MEIKILTNTVELDESTYLSRAKNSAMSITSTGVMLVNNGDQYDISQEGTTVDGTPATSPEHLASLLLPAFDPF